MTPTAELSIPDPLLYRQELSRTVHLFPLGQAVEIATNSSAIETAAATLWSSYPQLFDTPAMTLRLAVSDTESPQPFTGCVPRGQEHLVTMVGNAANFSVVDLDRGFGFAWLTHDVAENRFAVIQNFLEPIVYLMVSARHFAQVHGACVSLNGRGLVLCGESGAGKTCLAYACARAGWSLVSGDAIQIVRSSGGHDIIGRPFSIRFRESAQRLFPELQNRQTTRSALGKLDIEIDSHDLPIDTALQARASHVVFLNRDPAVTQAFFAPVSFDEALAYLMQVVFYGNQNLRNAQKQSLAELLDRPVVRLTYSDLEGAERALRHLLK